MNDEDIFMSSCFEEIVSNLSSQLLEFAQACFNEDIQIAAIKIIQSMFNENNDIILAELRKNLKRVTFSFNILIPLIRSKFGII